MSRNFIACFFKVDASQLEKVVVFKES